MPFLFIFYVSGEHNHKDDESETLVEKLRQKIRRDTKRDAKNLFKVLYNALDTSTSVVPDNRSITRNFYQDWVKTVPQLSTKRSEVCLTIWIVVLPFQRIIGLLLPKFLK